MSFSDFLGLIGFVTGVAGIILAIYYGQKSIQLEKAKRMLNWADLQAASQDLSSRLSESNFEPDLILTPGLRGATFANLFIGEFNKDIPTLVGTSSWKKSKKPFRSIPSYLTIETKKWFVHLPEGLLNFTDKKVLVLDDFSMSGDFLEKLQDLLISKGFQKENIRTLSIATTKIAIDNDKAPDFYWICHPDNDFYFPWGKAK